MFISHTSELREFPKTKSYVEAVERAISAAGHVVVDMADFAAAGQAPAQVCAARVRGCDVYVGVLGTRYGSLVRDRPGVSYTELEFDAATEAGLDRLVFMLDTEAEDPGIPASALIDREFGARQDAFRRRVQESGLTTQSFASPAVFNVEGVSIYYGSFRAVTNVSLTIHEHEITAFIGPSGCGKTTVLRTLNRMNDLIPGARVEGDVQYRGASLYAPGVSPIAVRRRIGMVFQKPNPFPKSIYDNVAYGPRINGQRNKGKLDEIVERSLRQAALWDEVKDRLNKSGLGLSGGQAQRLCIARTLAVEPDVVLMDEPCSALDPIATGRIEDLMHEIKSRYTIVIVTHNMQQAARVSDQTAFFNLEATGKPGRLIEIDDTEKIFSNPTQKATEDYISGRFG